MLFDGQLFVFVVSCLFVGCAVFLGSLLVVCRVLFIVCLLVGCRVLWFLCWFVVCCIWCVSRCSLLSLAGWIVVGRDLFVCFLVM